MLSTNSIGKLRGFLAGEIDSEGLWNWLAEAEYDEELSLEERDILSSVRLTAIEVEESERDVASLWKSVISLLKAELGVSPTDLTFVGSTGTFTAYMVDIATSATSEIRFTQPLRPLESFDGVSMIETRSTRAEAAAEFAQ